MAVYERKYRGYTGTLTPRRTRFLVLPRYAYAEVFRSRLFVTSLFFFALIVPFAWAVVVYLPHNTAVMALMQLQSEDLRSLFEYDSNFFFRFLRVQGFFAFLVAFVVGPALISADQRNNGMPLYLSRPFGRTEYILGKSSVLILLLSVVTWVPGLLLFLFHAYLMGFRWFGGHLRIGVAIFVSSWIWILILCLISLALSAYVKWKPIARAALFGVFWVLAALGTLVNGMLRTEWGSLIDLSTMLHVVWATLFGVPKLVDVPVFAAWAALLLACAGCVALLARKVRAYEIVR